MKSSAVCGRTVAANLTTFLGQARDELIALEARAREVGYSGLIVVLDSLEKLGGGWSNHNYGGEVSCEAENYAANSTSSGSSLDYYDLNGQCTGDPDEVNTRPPGSPEVAPIQWKKLSPGIRKALKQDKRIAYREEKKREHCKENKSSHRCKAAEHRLAQMVAAFIREGGSAPLPTELE